MQATGDDWEIHADFPPTNFLTHEAVKQHVETQLLPKAIEAP